MRNLINFLIKNSYWFLFIFLEVICFYFIFSGNSYQKSFFFNATNEVTGRVYSVSGSVLSYFGLKQENEELMKQNADMKVEISSLQDYIFSLQSDTIKTRAFLQDSLGRRSQPKYIVARVEKNSISMPENYIVISKGQNDGVHADMGVVSQQGIVGVVRNASANYAIIQPVLNPHSRFSCKILGSSADGILIWDGDDSRYAKLTQYPKYEKVNKGDTIITSGFSDFFPEGIMVGIVEDFKSETDDNFNSLTIRLSTDFGLLKNVQIIDNKNQEIKELEKSVKNGKK